VYLVPNQRECINGAFEQMTYVGSRRYDTKTLWIFAKNTVIPLLRTVERSHIFRLPDVYPNSNGVPLTLAEWNDGGDKVAWTSIQVLALWERLTDDE